MFRWSITWITSYEINTTADKFMTRVKISENSAKIKIILDNWYRFIFLSPITLPVSVFKFSLVVAKIAILEIVKPTSIDNRVIIVFKSSTASVTKIVH